MQYASPIYLKRSPYYLYRPYQLEIQRTTIPNNSAVLHRTPNLDILSEINRRSRRLERIVSYQKILTVTQICEMFQPILFATIAFITFYSVLRPTKSITQIAIASLVATLKPLFNEMLV
ncbi:Uncharacterized protein BM_BM8417 [Brugia malayi]|uniref:Uncharacterized protein n=1 Tax=Brugia malayi TaxID=6279 RepID=A0A4E9FTL0_BRUMA|nr:Uncharacterized protein BM_BM8417 [Brugia malayi]VIP00360.1 Uncharacterized protein BM_BM8417 [Brugia malayi]